MNLVKSILGAGVVGIPAGIAAWGDERTAVFPAVVLIACMATLAGYGFCLIGTVCYKTDAPSYREAWSRSVGKKSSWIPAMAAALVTTCTVLTCSIILADTLPSIVEALVPTTPSSGGAVDDEIGGGVAAISLPRNAALVLNTVLLTPLCLMQDLSKLAPFSVVGLLGTLYMAAAMCARYFANSYAVGKPLYETLAADSVPRFGAAGWKAAFQSSKIAILMSMLSVSLVVIFSRTPERDLN
jgi:amino acid permease